MIGALRKLAVLLGVLIAGPSHATDIAVIVHPDDQFTSLSLAELGAVFRRKLRVDPRGQAWIPVNLPVGHALRQSFSLSLYRKRPEDMREYWNEQYFHGISPPYVLASEEAITRFVAENPGAIAYVRSCLADSRVRSIMTLSPAPDAPALTDCD